MKRWWWLVFVLAGCTGTQEPALPGLVGVVHGSELTFFVAKDLQPGGGLAAPAPVGPASWDLGGAGVDAVRPVGRDEVWVLRPDALVRFSTAGLSTTAAPQPAGEVVLDLAAEGVDCTGGYLRPGTAALLVVCAVGDVWKVPYTGQPPERVGTVGDPSETRYALGPGDEVVRLDARQICRADCGADQTHALSPIGDPVDLVFDAETGRLYALFRDPFRVQALVWEPASAPRLGSPVDADALDPVLGLVVGQGRAVAFGDDLFTVDAEARVTPEERLAFGRYTAGLISPDAFLYLGRAGSVDVYDLLALSTRQARPVGLEPQALVFVPVQE
ncbi:hypothetical protein [Marinithermus hydrothermalis]|uniref:Uncharacterized protein n=1 Tax=Marinithermus hydrothermalis (strain DSM 14884 / JCM 11576 / T1) TaxID=869210 RepID=F2NKX1_MARHT|nr:hypothetical protein [Marinithermus hydrothermalis]AEB11160.1 hypothetical protein Marky_0408 [Marinithermus hydrothermalis DSM 14884]